MQNKLFLTTIVAINFLNVSPTKTDSSTDTCNERYVKLLEQQLDHQIHMAKEQENISKQQQHIIQILELNLQLKTHELEMRLEQQQSQQTAFEEEMNKPWYQKSWNFLVPHVQHALLNFIISSISAKIINTAIMGTDYITGDLPAQYGSSKLAIFAGTLFAAESLSEYIKKRNNKIIAHDPQVRAFAAKDDEFIQNHSVDIRIGQTAINHQNQRVLQKLGAQLQEELKKSANSSKTSHASRVIVVDDTPAPASTALIPTFPRTIEELRQQRTQKSSKTRHVNGITVEDVTDSQDFFK